MSEMLEEIPIAHLDYMIHEGAVGDWLVLGPVMIPLAEPPSMTVAARRDIQAAFLARVGEISQPPAERAKCTVTVGESEPLQSMWRVVNCAEDRRVDLAQWVETPHFLCAWSYAQVISPSRMTTRLRLTTASPTEVWINGEPVFAYDKLPDQPTQVEFTATLDEGTNEVLIRIANVGQGDIPLGVALQVMELDQGRVTLPTLLEPVARRQKLAAVMELAYLEQDVYAREQRVVLRWPARMQQMDALTARLQTPTGRIYREANPIVRSGAKVDFGVASQYPDGVYEVLLQPQFEEYYVQDMRIQRRLSLVISNQKWSTLYYGSAADRSQEALEDAARRQDTLFAELAKSALGKWEEVRREVIGQALEQLSQHDEGSVRAMVALLGWVARLGDLPEFPQNVELALEESVPPLLGHLETHDDILTATCHLLAGQLYPHSKFADSQSGAWHQERGEEQVLAWLAATAQMGLPGGESAQGYVDALLALSHLVDLAHADEIAEMAAVVLDKLAYQLALQSYVGVWGGSQDQANTQWLQNGHLGPLSGVFRLWWGQGAYNAECAATVALAFVENYELPEIIAAVGLDRQQENWLRRHDVRPALANQPHANRTAYRTGDYLLASAQGDWPAGTAALLWQVTLGPDMIVYGNRPACSSDHAAWQSNYWRGNAAPVRIAQWQDLLLVIYGQAEDAVLDFTHAYFPLVLFDEVKWAGGWVMARKGNGYVALTATGGVELVTGGRTAQREVRAAAQAVWLVQMGRAADDGIFAEFTGKVLARPLTLETDRVSYRTLRDQSVEMGMSTPLLVEDEPHHLSDFPHLESSAYGGATALPAESLTIQYQEHLMRLDLSTTFDTSVKNFEVSGTD
jgi:hypothetical protein